MSDRTLVVVFLRGGADGLHLAPPIGEGGRLYDPRPGLAIREDRARPLDDHFALHPGLAELIPSFREGRLAVVPACGSSDDTRSHFEAQDLMERGAEGVVGGGWLGRWLRERFRRGGRGGALPAVAVEKALPESLRGAPQATPIGSLGEAPDLDPALDAALGALYALDPELSEPARNAREAAKVLAAVGARRPQARYPEGPFGEGLARIAGLIAAGVGLRAACLDLPGWDSHFVQATVLDPLVERLGRGLAAFADDLGPRLDTTSVVVMSEFGRRVHENAAAGTDHGRGGVMLVLGGGVQGGVRGTWPGLAPEALDGPGDVAVANDYRDVLVAVLRRHGDFDPRRVFPGHAVRRLVV